MAFQKRKAVKGYEANYWRILQINTYYNDVDVNMTICLYKDEATRLADPMAVVHSFTHKLEATFADRNPTVPADDMRSVTLKEAYLALQELAVAEAAKPREDRNVDLAYFSDAVEV